MSGMICRIAFCVLILAPISYAADTAEPTTPAVRQATAEYDAAVKKAQAEVTAAKEAYLAKLDAAVKQVMQAGDLEEANRIDGLRKSLRNNTATNASPANPAANNTRAKPGWITGNITDSTGKPIEGAQFEVTVFGTTIAGGEKTSLRLDVDDKGHFEQQLPDGLYAVTAYVEKDYNNSRFHVQLHPTDNKPETTKSASKPGIVKDFVWKLGGVRPGVDPKASFGHYGAALRLYDAQYLGDADQKLLGKFPPKSLAHVTLTPKGPAIDGSRIDPVTIKGELSALGDTLGQLTFDIPIAAYTIEAKIVTPDGKTTPLKSSLQFRGPFEAKAELMFVQKSIYQGLDPISVYFSQ